MKLNGIKNIGGSVLGLSLGASLFLTFLFGFCANASLQLGLPEKSFYLITLNTFVFIVLAVLVSPKSGTLSLKVLAFLCFQLGRLVFSTISGPVLNQERDLSVIFIYFPDFFYLLLAEALLWVFLEVIFLIASKLSQYPFQFWISILWWIIIGYVSLEMLSMKSILIFAIIITLIIKFYQLFLVEEWLGNSLSGYVFSLFLPFLMLFVAFFYGEYLNKERQCMAQSIVSEIRLYRAKYGSYPTVKTLQDQGLNVTDYKEVYNYMGDQEDFSNKILSASAGYYSSSENRVIYQPYKSGAPYVAYIEPLSLSPCIYVYDFNTKLWVNSCEKEELETTEDNKTEVIVTKKDTTVIAVEEATIEADEVIVETDTY